MRKNGFIATSLLYAFFLVFISLFVALLLAYLHNRLLISKINDDARNSLTNINNIKLSDINVGSYVQWKNSNPTAKTNPMNESGKWILSKVEEDDENKTLYLLSDLTTSYPSVRAILSTDNGLLTPHPMTIAVFNELNTQGAYVNSLKYHDTHENGMEISIVDATFLQELSRSNDINKNLKRAIFKQDASYVVKVGDTFTSDGYTSPYTYEEVEQPSYYEYRVYNFDNYKGLSDEAYNEKQRMISTYCGASYDKTNDTINYSYESEGTTYNNPFGYVDIMDDTSMNVNKEIVNDKHIDFCYFASPVKYQHYATDLVLMEDETSPDNGDLLTTLKSSGVRLRLMMKVVVPKNATDTFVAGGKGIFNDPYIVTNGVKLS